MRQKAVVLETNGNIAKVRVQRSSMCAGCAQRGSAETCACGALMGAKQEMISEAVNEIGAQPGEDVMIETASSVVLGYAALVFFVPLVAFFLFYTAAETLCTAVYIPWLSGCVGFVLSFVLILLLDRNKRKRSSQICIVERLQHFSTESEEDK